ncbi:hypothetical protein FQA47_019458 [Oryzias melastigma]|uniref:Uncharacterized protein n=1 Tax=Oryzias melastigma TaxID=30732 RepID=A0A834C6N2_ORYME|nr:hypothetical protein FQA47_019458 [Oryzias melastigma]
MPTALKVCARVFKCETRNVLEAEESGSRPESWTPSCSGSQIVAPLIGPLVPSDSRRRLGPPPPPACACLLCVWSSAERAAASRPLCKLVFALIVALPWLWGAKTLKH